MSKKILTIFLISNSSWYFYNFKKKLIKDLSVNYKVILFMPDYEYSKFLKDHNISCIKIPSNLNSKINFFEPFVTSFFLLKKISIHSPSLIISYTAKANLYTSLVCWYSKTKYITNITGLGNLFLKKNIFIKILFKTYLTFIKKSAKTIVQNESDYIYFKNKNFTNVVLIESSGIDLIKKNNFKKRIIDNEKLSFLMVARLIIEKGINEYLEASKIIKKNFPNVTFSLIGSSNNNKINKKISKYHKFGHINYIGYMNNASEKISHYDCIVLPSYREGSSRVLLESCKYEIPIITTDVPGCNNIAINNYNSILCEPKNTDSLISAINKFINLEPQQIYDMGINGRIHVKKKFDINFINKQTIEQINKTINDK